MEFRAVELSLVAFLYVAIILFFQSLFEEYILPRLNFSKTSSSDIRQMMVRWVLFSRRFDFEFRRDAILLLQISFLLTAIATLPLSGIAGLNVDRPDLAIAELMAIFYFLRVLAGWKSGNSANWEKALEEVVFAGARIFVFLLITDGAYLAASDNQFEYMLGRDGLLFSGPFHFLGFILGIFMVGFFQGRQGYKKDLNGLALFAWNAEPILWITLLLVTFLNTSVVPGVSYFFLLVVKCLAILSVLSLVRFHMPKVRMDQLERIGLTVVYPFAILVFLGMWWQETMK